MMRLQVFDIISHIFLVHHISLCDFEDVGRDVSQVVTKTAVDTQSSVLVFVLQFGRVSHEHTQERLKPIKA